MRMRSIWTALLAALFLTASAAAQTPTPYEMLQLYRQDYPAEMSKSELAELLNRVAWDFRSDGMALLGKPAGNNCPLPSGVLISCDFLVHAPTKTGHDVIADTHEDGLSPAHPRPFTWGPGPVNLAAAILDGSRSIVFPTEPAGSQPTPTPEPTPQPEPLPSFDWSPFLNANQVLLGRIGELQTLVEALRAEQRAHIENEDRRWSKVEATWKKVLLWGGAVAGPIVTAILQGKKE